MKKIAARIIPAVFSAGCFAVLAELLSAALNFTLPLPVWLLLLAGAAALLIFLKAIPRKALWRIFLWLAAAMILSAVIIVLALGIYGRAARYESVDDGKAALYSGKKVMIIAPHEDDDLNIACGVTEEYLRYGSSVRIVFATNGDRIGLGEKRMREALKVCADLGIPESEVVFLGYGNEWGDGSVHIYDSQPDALLPSRIGRTETYGLNSHPAYHDSNSYTRANMLADIKGAILDYMPDVILCNDADDHPDHAANSMLFEEAMGEILRENPGYEPVVLKSLCYYTAYRAVEDFYSPNIFSTRQPYDCEYIENVNIYAWSERVRLPVSAEGLSRGMLGCDNYKRLSMYASQGITDMADGIINGDKVFWLRDTSSLCYDADITVSSGDGARLNDFKLLDASPLMAMGLPDDGAWMPDGDDGERSARVVFPEPRDISEIRLYDNPGADDNVLNAKISFDDGSSIETGALLPTGGATVINVDKSGVTGFTVQLLDFEGERTGLTEIEAYSTQKDFGLDYIKLTNAEGDFVYDYFIDESGTESFSLYASGKAAALDGGEYSLSCEGEGCSASISGDEILVSCPRGKSCIVRISSADGSLSDAVYISNPGSFARSAGQSFENFCRHQLYGNLRKSNSYLLLQWTYRMIRYGTADPMLNLG